MVPALKYQIAPFDRTNNDLRPVLILLHGRGSDEKDLLGLVPYLDPRAICIAPRAPFAFAYGGYMWYDLQEIAKPDENQFKESCNRLSAFIADIQKDYPIDPHRVYLLGFSMGAVMAYSLALTKPQQIRGIIAHSGYIPEHLSNQFVWEKLSVTSFFVAHGIHDPVIPIEFGRKAKELLTHYNARLIYREYPIQHQISDESLHDLSEWLTKHLEVSP